MGGIEAATPVPVEPQVKYHHDAFEYLTNALESGIRTVSEGQFDWAVSSKIVTEEPEGTLSTVGNRV